MKTTKTVTRKTSVKKVTRKTKAPKYTFDYTIDLQKVADFNDVERQIISQKLKNNIALRKDEVEFIINDCVDYAWERLSVYPNNVVAFAYRRNKFGGVNKALLNTDMPTFVEVFKAKKPNFFKRMWNKIFKKNK